MICPIKSIKLFRCPSQEKVGSFLRIALAKLVPIRRRTVEAVETTIRIHSPSTSGWQLNKPLVYHHPSPTSFSASILSGTIRIQLWLPPWSIPNIQSHRPNIAIQWHSNLNILENLLCQLQRNLWNIVLVS